MDVKNFERLKSSIKEIKEIISGQKEPSRKFFIEDSNPKNIVAKLSLTQEKFIASMSK